MLRKVRELVPSFRTHLSKSSPLCNRYRRGHRSHTGSDSKLILGMGRPRTDPAFIERGHQNTQYIQNKWHASHYRSFTAKTLTKYTIIISVGTSVGACVGVDVVGTAVGDVIGACDGSFVVGEEVGGPSIMAPLVGRGTVTVGRELFDGAGSGAVSSSDTLLLPPLPTGLLAELPLPPSTSLVSSIGSPSLPLSSSPQTSARMQT